MACLACPGALSADRAAKHDEEPPLLELVLHDAELLRSFAKVGSMRPYVVVSIGGREVYRSPVVTSADKHPRWESTCTVRSENMPKALEVSVRSSTRVGTDNLCGSVVVPCSEGMPDLAEKEFWLTKHGQTTGALRLSLSRVTAATLLSPSASKGLFSRSKSFMHSASSMMFDSTVDSTLIDEEPQNEDSKGAETKRASTAEKVPADIPEEQATAAIDLDSLQILMGTWTCIATEGLEDFLKHAGVGIIQRKIALAAKWPTWDFSLSGERVIFINHAQLGDLREEVVLDGSTYEHKDLQGHALTCRAKWEKTPDGGVLTMWRDSQVGSFHETRRVAGDSLEFMLTKADGKSWGRTFKRG